MQLAYFYLIESDRGINNLEFNFTENFEFKVDIIETNNCAQITISKKESNVNQYIFQEFPNITRTDIIVGENGIGKSTVLECLSFGVDTGDCEWFALVYQNGKWLLYKDYENDEFYVIIKDENDEGGYIATTIDIVDSFKTRLINNTTHPEWVYKYKYKPENEYSNSILCVFDFLMDAKGKVEEFIPVNRISFGFNLGLHFNDWALKRSSEIKGFGNHLVDLIQNVTNILQDDFNAKPLILGKRNRNLPEWYEMFNRTVTDFMSGLFYRQIDNTESNIVDMVLILLQLDWVIGCSITGNGYRLEMVDMCCRDKNTADLQNLFINLYNITKELDAKKLYTNTIINKYLREDFIKLLKNALMNPYFIIEVHNSAGFQFKIQLYNLKRKNMPLKLIKDLRQFILIVSMFKESSNKSHLFKDKYSLQRMGYANISSGEMAYLNLFSKIYDSILFSDPEIENAENILLLLDEPDISFHPEWSRKLSYKLLQVVDYLFESNNCKGQIIITTHSPFMVSDFPTNCVTCINSEDKIGLEREHKTYKVKNSFAANIYDLLNDGFYMKAPVGELAKSSIQKIIESIDSLQDMVKDSEKILYIETVLSIISDKLVRGRINELYQQKKEKLPNYHVNRENNAIILLQKEIVALKKELDNLKKRVDRNDSIT